MEGWRNYGKNYTWFCVLFLIGVLMLIISLFTLPVFVVMPAKMAVTFNVGAICILLAFGINNGFKVFFIDRFFNAERPKNIIAIAFFICMILTLLFAIVWDSFIGTLIFLILEWIALIYFVASCFPGGTEGVSVFFKTLGTGIKNACTKCCNKDNS